jgi:hypothetical protein
VAIDVQPLVHDPLTPDLAPDFEVLVAHAVAPEKGYGLAAGDSRRRLSLVSNNVVNHVADHAGLMVVLAGHAGRIAATGSE